ncbi:MAG TPA: biopolymer transporter ExbD [Rhodocyclaceae bacterium]
MASGLRRRRSHPPEELNVTAFMNLMVVLVPFLLISAVFNQITIHELNLPTLSEPAVEPKEDKPTLVLEVIIRKDSLDVQDRNSGRLKLIPNGAIGHDFVALKEKLREIKVAFPAVAAATLLLEQDVPYDVLIQTMDAVRTDVVKKDGADAPVELFPDVSIGDAPRLAAEATP